MTNREIIGLIPAAGTASRIAPLPCSKELYPVGFRSVDSDGSLRPKVVSHYLLEKMRLAEITKVFIILRDGKWDIPSYFGDGKMLDMDLAYLMMDLPYGAPFTLDQAYPFVQNAIIALGFPDIVFQPENAFVRLLAKQKESNANIVLGLFPTSHPHKTDMVDLDDNGRVRSIQIKPDKTHLIYTWQIAVWTPRFTRFMHDYISDQERSFENNRDIKELFVGDVIQAAMQNNMEIDTVLFEDGNCLDIGTPEDLIKAVRTTSRIVI
jgi:glucose-1-phosphate thymidylyltransferase